MHERYINFCITIERIHVYQTFYSFQKSFNDLPHPRVDSSNDNEWTEKKEYGEEASPHIDTVNSVQLYLAAQFILCTVRQFVTRGGQCVCDQGHTCTSPYLIAHYVIQEEQYGAAEEAGITTVTLKDMGNRTRCG